jgi:aerobic carbon-monoxide dehydrogenase medium subunit
VTPFHFSRATSIADARKQFSAAADPRYLAGGQTLLPVMKQRLAAPSDLIALAKITELSGVTVTAGDITIGAMTRHADVAASSDIRRVLPALAHLAGGIGDPHVRNRGTIGGSLANSDPSADYPAAVLGLGATIHTEKRAIPAGDFFLGMFTTALEPGELITRVTFPLPQRAGYIKFPNPASRYAVVGVMVSQSTNGIRVAVTGAGPNAFRVPDMEAALARTFTPEAIASIKVSAGGLNSDIHASSEYRAHLVSVITKRAIHAAIAGYGS